MESSKQLPSIFMQMHNGTRTGEGSFNQALKNIFYAADNSNRYKLVAAFPEFFGTEVPEFEIFKKPELNTINDLLELMVIYGCGSIIWADPLPPYEIDQAEASGRLYTDSIGRKFIWDPEVIDFPTSDAEVEFFEKWYPLEMTPPEGLFDEIMARINSEAHKKHGDKAWKLTHGKESFIARDFKSISEQLSLIDCEGMIFCLEVIEISEAELASLAEFEGF